MPSVVFYSWQSDLPNAANRSFIQTALERAARSLRDDETIEVEPVIDRDTAGVPGSPDISGTIFDKINRAAVFVCDVSIINNGETTSRPTPNPNVLIELGYALHSLTWERVIMVQNTSFGGPELLPFDLRMRRVIPYNTPGEAEERATERRRLEGVLTDALRAILAGEAAPIGETVQPASVSEQTRIAIEEGQANRVALVNRFMVWLAGEVTSLTLTSTEENRTQWGDLLLHAIEQTRGLVAEFSRVAEAIAASNDPDAARALYHGFTGILDLYQPAAGFSGAFWPHDFDVAKFVGHELFVTFISSFNDTGAVGASSRPFRRRHLHAKCWRWAAWHGAIH